MKPVLPILYLFFGVFSIRAQDRVAIGHMAPVAKLDILGIAASPSIPGSTSNGVIRIGVSSIEGIDIGKMAIAPYSGWLQAGYNGNTTDPLVIQPLGGAVGVGTSAPNASAQLDVSSTTAGFLPPRMTSSQRDAIQNPVEGLMIWCTDCSEINVFNGATWLNLKGTAPTLNPPHVIICNQDWMAKNLDVSTYSNGDPIPKVTDLATWISLTTGAYCYYANDSTTYAATYGKLYNWYAVNDPRGLAPVGWHVPTHAEWSTLGSCLGGDMVAGGPMKESGTNHWQTPNTGATNQSGFTGLPGGKRFNNGDFYEVGQSGYFWTATTFSSDSAWRRILEYDEADLGTAINFKIEGYAVRCVRN